jgi:bifunctional DNase/RNase
MSDALRVNVDSISFDENTSLYRIALKDPDSGKVLPIFIGAFEGNAIAIAIRGIPTVRPLTHDLLRSLIEKLNGKVSRIVVTALKDNIYYAYIYIHLEGQELAIDSRPSDAIALATRIRAPIYVSYELRDKFVDEFEELMFGVDPGETIH